MKIKKILLIIITLTFFLWQGQTFGIKFIELKQYQNIKSKLKHKIKKKNLKIIKKIITRKTKTCKYLTYGDYYLVSASCFLNKNFKIDTDFKKTIDDVLPFIKEFNYFYDLDATDFLYTTAKPSFYIDYNIDNFVKQKIEDKILLHILSSANYYIKIPKLFFEFKKIKDYSFYVSTKDLTLRNKQRLQNFNVALNKLDGYLLKGGKTLNINKLIANLPGYSGKGNFIFYGGVCGVSTLLFRNALINPYLYVKKRYNHNQRYVNFYSNYIYGDDASIYQYDKILEIKNISKWPIYFRKKRIGKKLFFISVIPIKSDRITYVSKKEVSPLKAILINQTLDKDFNIIYEQKWISKYSKKNYEK